MSVLNGAYIKGAELEEFIEKVFSDENFSLLMEAVTKYQPLSKEDLQARKAYKFDAELAENEVVSGRYIVFSDKSNQFNIIYRESFNTSIPEEFQLVANVLVDYDDNKKKSLIGLSIKDGNVEEDFLSQDYPSSILKDVEEDLPDDPDYTAGRNGSFSPLAWWNSNGCMPGGYQHCGGNCGNTGDHGGGSPINQTDSCCVLHDDCYRSGITRCKCDAMIVQCVRNHKTATGAAITAYFGPKSC